MVASHTLSLQSFVNSVKQQLDSLLEKSGTVLYISCETLKPGQYYFLGLNPGGSEEIPGTILQSLDELALGKSTKNAYLDENWSGSRSYDVECHPLQKNFKSLFEALEQDTSAVCASNLIFKRSPSEGGSGYPSLARLCWPVHEKILEIVQPRAIITFGRQPFEFVATKLGGSSVQRDNSGYSTWKWSSLIKERSPALIGLPHLSIYPLRCRPEVIEKIKSLIG